MSVGLHWHCSGGGCSEHLEVDLGRVEFLVLEKAEIHLPHYLRDLPVATGECASKYSEQLGPLIPSWYISATAELPWELHS